ncbi:Short-chain dehydrogenase [Psilocybe cubensis]|uniref:NAD(P)-binding protein n=2 Tax=Psilocybe cubensis TaxID=181762 RepID=A0A8H7XQN1_PSICU|nr:Short-chain dehydrogenase [Psilocybe cubensis]KAH9480641.1 Short-chain dehydrogenase [Psilocybe cubensis]
MGVLVSVIRQGYPPKSRFSVGDIPDLSGKVMIVTGGSVGIGRETVKALLHHNAKVYIAARNEEASRKTIEELKNETDKEAVFLKLDLGDFQSIKAAVTEFQSKESKLDVLFNNAGVMAPPVDLVTAQGYDLQFGTNTLGHFYFTTLLLPQLFAGAKSSPDNKARVINTASAGAELASGIDFDTIKDGPKRKKKGTHRLYLQSKLGNVVFSNELARRYGDKGIVSVALNPGNIESNLQRHLGYWDGLLVKSILWPLQYGALTQLYAGTTPEGAELNGKYLIPWARIGNNLATATPKLGEELWNFMEEQIKDV